MFFKSFFEGPICQTCICFYFLALYIPYIVNSVMVLAELIQLGILALGLHPVAGFLKQIVPRQNSADYFYVTPGICSMTEMHTALRIDENIAWNMIVTAKVAEDICSTVQAYTHRVKVGGSRNGFQLAIRKIGDR